MRNVNLIICILLLWTIRLSSRAAAEEASAVVGPVTAADREQDASRQLRIFEEALLRGSTDQSRTDAAIELLRRGDDGAWEVLMKALLNGEHAAGRQAVCRGLIASRSWPDNLRSRKPFLEPLLSILIDTSGADARLAAEALLVFRYAEVSERLGRMARMTELNRQVRLNVVYTLRLWPDKDAVLDLVNLLDDADPEVASAASAALPYWIGTAADKQTILKELQRKTPDEIIKARLEGLQQQMTRLEGERDSWKRLYLAALDREYEKSDEDGKGKMLVEKMAAEHAPVRQWAVHKTAAFTGSRPKGFRDNLLSLISDKDREIRLAAARVLANMSALDPAAKLLAQLKVEPYSKVSLAIFDALGEACFFASSPGSPIALEEGIRAETLAIAGKYLQNSDVRVAMQGAAVLGKLLELNNLEGDGTESYLGLLAERYQQTKGTVPALRGEIVAVMSRLCVNGSHRQKAAVLFRPFFLEGLGAGDDNTVREASATGLMNIDKSAAFRHFKENGLANDPSVIVRRTVVRLAGELGGAEDVAWLAERINGNGEAEAAWQGMRDILLRQDAKAVYAWAQKVAAGEDKYSHARELLEMAEKKAEAAQDADLLRGVRTDLCDWYGQRGDYAKVIAYADQLLRAASGAEKENLQLRLLEAYLQTADAAKATVLMGERLAVMDTAADDAFAARIGTFLGLRDINPGTKTAVVEALGGIKAPAARPRWTAQLNTWRNIVAAKPAQPVTAASVPPTADK